MKLVRKGSQNLSYETIPVAVFLMFEVLEFIYYVKVSYELIVQLLRDNQNEIFDEYFDEYFDDFEQKMVWFVPKSY